MKKTHYKVYYENDEGEYVEFKFHFDNDADALQFGRTWLQSYIDGLPGHNWAYSIINPNGTRIN